MQFLIILLGGFYILFGLFSNQHTFTSLWVTLQAENWLSPEVFLKIVFLIYSSSYCVVGVLLIQRNFIGIYLLIPLLVISSINLLRAIITYFFYHPDLLTFLSLFFDGPTTIISALLIFYSFQNKGIFC